MSVGAILIGFALFMAGILCATLLRNKLQHKALDIQFMKTTPLKELKETFADLTDFGNGLRQYVELQGVSSSAFPPNAPYSQHNVAYYTAELIQVYETQEFYNDNQGQPQHRIVRREEMISSEKSVEPLLLQDTETGETVSLDLREGGLQLDLMEGHDRFVPVDNMHSYSFFSTFVPSQLGNHTLGYHLREKIIPLGHPLYVLGDAYLRGNTIFIGRPSDKKKPFVVSTKSKNQLAGDAKQSSTLALVGGLILATIGIAIMVKGFF